MISGAVIVDKLGFTIRCYLYNEPKKVELIRESVSVNGVVPDRYMIKLENTGMLGTNFYNNKYCKNWEFDYCIYDNGSQNFNVFNRLRALLISTKFSAKIVLIFQIFMGDLIDSGKYLLSRIADNSEIWY